MLEFTILNLLQSNKGASLFKDTGFNIDSSKEFARTLELDYITDFIKSKTYVCFNLINFSLPEIKENTSKLTILILDYYEKFNELEKAFHGISTEPSCETNRYFNQLDRKYTYLKNISNILQSFNGLHHSVEDIAAKADTYAREMVAEIDFVLEDIAEPTPGDISNIHSN